MFAQNGFEKPPRKFNPLWPRGCLALPVLAVLIAILLTMADKRLPFTQITQALPNLSTDNLLSLLKTVHEVHSKAASDPAFTGKEFQAEATFLEKRTDQYLTLDELLQLIKGLNPAELEVLSYLIHDYVLDNLIPYKFVGVRYSGGDHYSSHVGPTGDSFSSTGMIYAVPKGVSLDDIQQRDKLREFTSNLVMYCTLGRGAQDDIQRPAQLIKSMVDLAQSAQQAKAAGNQQKASELYKQAMSLLKEHGVSGSWLELLRNRWPV